jgi:hypothetical protein
MNKEPANEEAKIDSHRPVRPSPREISDRAYFYYLNAGSSHGHDLEHWLRAEKDLMLGHPRTVFHGSHN